MLQDQEKARNIYSFMEGLLETVEAALDYMKNYDMPNSIELIAGFIAGEKSLEPLLSASQSELPSLHSMDLAKSCLFSAAKILDCLKYDFEYALKRTEFELLPLVEELLIDYYYWGMVYPDQTRLDAFYSDDIFSLANNRYIEASAQSDSYKYDLSICVIANNELSYTKQCISRIRHLCPKELRSELILVSNGEAKETTEYFEQLFHDKELNIQVKNIGLSAVTRVVEGKYTLFINDDVLITHNAIDNLFKCIDSDETIGWAAPAIPNLSVFQAPQNISYDNLDELDEICRKINVSHPYHWEQKTELTSPISIIRSDLLWNYKPQYLYYSSNASLSDARMSLTCRRNGYKMMLVKDAYCHYYNLNSSSEDDNAALYSVTQAETEAFMNSFGISPFCRKNYSFDLFQKLELNNNNAVSILSLEDGLCANGLKLKELYKEKAENTSVFLTACTLDPNYFDDIKGIADSARLIENIDSLCNDNEKHDYTVIQTEANSIDELKRIIDIANKCTKDDGTILLAVRIDLLETATAPIIDFHYERFYKANDLNSGEIWLIIDKANQEKLPYLSNALDDQPVNDNNLPQASSKISNNSIEQFYLPPHDSQGFRIVRINGGLGNQLYQYAFGRFIEIATGEPCIYDDSPFYANSEGKIDHNGYELEKIFNVKLNMLSALFDKEVWAEMIQKRNKGVSIPQQLKDNGLKFVIYAETNDYKYDGPIIKMPVNSPSNDIFKRYVNTSGNVYYNGYWCALKPFVYISDTLRKELTFPSIASMPGAPDEAKRNLALISSTHSIALHIRRGDFIACNRSLTADKYYAAVRTMDAKYPGYDFFVFSDDINWCKECRQELGLNDVSGKVYFVEGTTGNGYNYMDMQLMSMCNKQIISNSSFGIWAFLLNVNQDVEAIIADSGQMVSKIQ